MKDTILKLFSDLELAKASERVLKMQMELTAEEGFRTAGPEEGPSTEGSAPPPDRPDSLPANSSDRFPFLEPRGHTITATII